MAIQYLDAKRIRGSSTYNPYTSSLGTAGDLDAGVFPAGASSVTTPTGLGDDYWVCLADRLEPTVQLCPINSDFTIAFWIYPTGSIPNPRTFGK